MKALECIARVLRIVAAVCLVIMMLITAVDISMRLLLNELILGSVEMVSLMVVAVVFLAIPETFLRDQQITVDAIDLFVPEPVQQFLRLVASLLTLLMLMTMFGFMLPMAADTLILGDRTTDLQFSLFWYWLPILVGVLGAVLAMIGVSYSDWRTLSQRPFTTAESARAD